MINVYNRQVYSRDIDIEQYQHPETNKLCTIVVLVVGGTPAGMTRVIPAASCYEHPRKHNKKGVPWGGILMLRRCQTGKETSGPEIRGGRRAGEVGWRRDVGKVRHHVWTQSALGMASGRGRRRGWKHDVGCIRTRRPRLRRRINFC